MTEPDDPEGGEPVRIEFTDELDLHPFHPRDAGPIVEDYLDHAAAQGWASVRIVHGKGIGMLRAQVHAICARHPAVARIRADERGGWGVTIVEMRRREG